MFESLTCETVALEGRPNLLYEMGAATRAGRGQPYLAQVQVLSYLPPPTSHLQPPTFDSKKENYAKFETDFCSYVIIQGGERLVDEVIGVSGMHSTIIHHSSSSPGTYNSDVVSGASGESGGEDEFKDAKSDSGEGVAPLTSKEQSLNSKFYHRLRRRFHTVPKPCNHFNRIHNIPSVWFFT